MDEGGSGRLPISGEAIGGDPYTIDETGDDIIGRVARGNGGQAYDTVV